MSGQKLHFWLLLLGKSSHLISEWFLKQFFCLTGWKTNGMHTCACASNHQNRFRLRLIAAAAAV
jgi:hypothetical protein